MWVILLSQAEGNYIINFVSDWIEPVDIIVCTVLSLTKVKARNEPE